MTSSAQMYGYVRPSALAVDGPLDLQTSGGLTATGPAAHPRFAALRPVRGGDPLKPEVGPDGRQATTFDGTVEEAVAV